MKTRASLCCLLFHVLWCCVLGAPLLSSRSQGQVPQSQSDQLADLVNRAKSGNFIATDIKIIAQAGAAREVIPALEEQFAHTEDPAKQGLIASALLRLGDSDGRYWDFLLQQATSAVESDMPDPFHDAAGHSTGRQPSPEFVAWTQAHHIDLNSAIQAWVYGFPGKVLDLSMVSDPRSVPILRRALKSQNSFVVMMASEGLARLKDKESIPAIIAACRRFDKDAASAIAEGSLLYFDDPQAQAEVDAFVPQDRARARREARARGKTPFDF